MHAARLARWLLIYGCVCVSACTETIIKEIPASSSQEAAAVSQTDIEIPTPLPLTTPPPTAPVANPTVSDPVLIQNQTPTPTPDNMVSGVSSEPTGDTVAAPDTTANATDLETEPTVNSPSVMPPVSNEPVTSDPGVVVDCMQKLPCRWISDDTQLSVTVTNADNIATRGRLSIQFTVSTSHDTQIAIARADSAIDATALEFAPEDYVLGAGNGITPQVVASGGSVDGTLNFDQTGTSESIASWSIALIDGGLVRNAAFSNIPIGSVTSDYADCANTLPCVWVSPSQEVTITLLSASGLSTTNRLSVNLSIQTAGDMSVALDAGASAIGSDGTQFVARTHTLGTVSNHDKVTVETMAGTVLPANIDFFRTATSPESLQNLSLIIYNDRPVPRWNPRFTAVPVL